LAARRDLVAGPASGYWCKAHYLDASALVKLVDDSPGESSGRDVLRKYYNEHSSMYATSYCLAEAFGVFKRRFLNNEINEGQYIEYVQGLIRLTVGWKLQLDEVDILLPIVSSEAERLIRKWKHKIDFLDCIQIVTVLHGRNRVLVGESRSILITADNALAKAARAEGARVWECNSETDPA
jgi:predicted nucleic acid-binding protein